MSKDGLFFDPNQVKMVVESLSNEKDLAPELIFVAMERALASVLAKDFSEQARIQVNIDRDTGVYHCQRVWTLVEDASEELLDQPEQYLSVDQAQEKGLEGAVLGETVAESLTIEPGRIFAHQSGQMMIKFVREAERAKLAEQFKSRVGELMTGQVKRVTRDHIIIDLGDHIEASLPRKELLPREIFRVGDRARGYLYAVDPENKGPLLMLSRTHANFLVELFKLEVPEIQEGVLEIKSVARDPGVRAKIAVKTKDARVDAVGACVGMRGGRVQAISSELNGERVDIILWDESPAKMVISAMSPAEVLSIVVDEPAHAMDVVVLEANLSQAIGRGGQNVRLASQLVGWDLNVMSESQQREQSGGSDVNALCQQLDVDAALAEILIREGFSNIEHLAKADAQVLAGISEFDIDLATEILDRAQSAMIAEAIAVSTLSETAVPDESLMALPNMPKLMAHRLAASGIISAEDLAEMSVDEVRDIEGMTDHLAADLIMAARAPWFSEDED
ncbi:MAG: transcription termination/antitermination protein NusA [Legionellales bacterium]|nr:transcription termination/antitermination protein NusA [Legionellales bacterium]